MLYIRVDMNDTIATGHVMRCLSIADAARRLGEESCFLLADDHGAGLLQGRGYAYHILHTDWRDMEGELPVLKSLIDREGITSLLIDSYQVTFAYLERLSAWVKTMYLDDVNAFGYPVHALLCYAVYAEQFRFHYQQHCREAGGRRQQLLLGPRYAPLRPVFGHNRVKRIAERAEHLLLLSGGTDPYDILWKLLEGLAGTEYRQITVICGRYYPKYDALRLRHQGDKRICLLQAVDNIQDYMEQADMAVSAGGSTLYELAALGTPAITYALADNQWENVREFHRQGLMDYAGDVRTEPVVERILELLAGQCQDSALRRERSERLQKLVDGRGAERIVREWIR